MYHLKHASTDTLVRRASYTYQRYKQRYAHSSQFVWLCNKSSSDQRTERNIKTYTRGAHTQRTYAYDICVCFTHRVVHFVYRLEAVCFVLCCESAVYRYLYVLPKQVLCISGRIQTHALLCSYVVMCVRPVARQICPCERCLNGLNVNENGRFQFSRIHDENTGIRVLVIRCGHSS